MIFFGYFVFTLTSLTVEMVWQNGLFLNQAIKNKNIISMVWASKGIKNKNLERIGVHDGMGDRSPNQLFAELTAH